MHKVILGYCPVSWGLRISALNVVFPALSASGEQVLHPVFVLLLRIKDFNFNLPRAENLTSDPTVVPTVLESLISYLNYTLKQLYKVDLMSTLPTSKIRLRFESNSLKIL